ncbi:MAG: heavy-metal-associated domain-containing protein [Halobacteriaceae archaeon]
MTTIVIALGQPSQVTRMERKTISVTGLSCTGCEQTVTNALKTLDGVNRVEADHEADTVEVVAGDSVTDDDIHAAIEQAGYEVTA